MSQFLSIKIEDVIQDTATQSRVVMEMENVTEYAEAMARGDAFPAIIVYQENAEGPYVLADGWYRIMAAKEAGISELLAEVCEGDLDDAILYAAGSNVDHGVRRSNDDKHKSVTMLLENDKWKGMSSRAIALATSVDHKTVERVRESLQLGNSPVNGDQDGSRVGLDGKSRPAKAKKKEKAEPQEVSDRRTTCDILKEIYELYTELPRSAKGAAKEVAAMPAIDDSFGASRAQAIAVWFELYAGATAELDVPNLTPLVGDPPGNERDMPGSEAEAT